MHQLERRLAKQPGRIAPLMMGNADDGVPLIGLSAVDATARTVTFILDAVVEIFDPENAPADAH